MRVLVWVRELGWEACVDAAAGLSPREVTLLAVAGGEALAAGGGAAAGLLGRRRPPELEARMAGLAEESARELVAAAAARLGRPARTEVARGRPEEVVTAAARDAELLVLARSGSRPGPRSLEHAARFVVDHAPGPVLVVWP